MPRIIGGGWRQACRHYQRLMRDSASAPYNRLGAASILVEGLEGAPAIRNILTVLGEAGVPLRSTEISERVHAPKAATVAELLYEMIERSDIVSRRSVKPRHGPNDGGHEYLYELTELGQAVYRGLTASQPGTGQVE